MIRFLVPLLLVLAGALVTALVRDRRQRQEWLLGGLRGGFLHGSPLGGHAPARGLAVRAAPGNGLSLRLPPAWSGGFESPTLANFDCGSGRRLRLELLTLERPLGSEQALLGALGATKPEAERSLETLPDGKVLLKFLDVGGQAPNQQIVFSWHLAGEIPSQQVRLAAFTFSVPAHEAREVFVQADLALLDREIRASTFGQ